MKIKVAGFLGLLALSASIHCASALSVPGPEAQLMHRASQKCVEASGLKQPSVANTIDFRDQVLVVIDDGLPQRHAGRLPARYACLFDKRTETADINPFPR